MTKENIIGNVYDKYGTRNPIARYLMTGFLNAVTELFNQTQLESVLEVGCGEGKLIDLLIKQAVFQPKEIVACDLSLDQLETELHPAIQFKNASVYSLPFKDNSFDLVICCEVLEHLEKPEAGLIELVRVARKGVLVSTPREPLWRFLNVIRGRYLKYFGNTPGHIQHFSRRRLINLLKRYVWISDVRQPVPWIVLLGKPL